MDDVQVEADVDKWFDGLKLDERTVLQVFPGKELLKVIRTLITDKYSVDIREGDLRGALNRNRLAEDMKNTFTRISERKKA